MLLATGCKLTPMVEPARCHFCLDMGCDMCSPSEKSGGEAPRSFSGLRADEQERLALLAEEMGEVIQVIGKAQSVPH